MYMGDHQNTASGGDGSRPPDKPLLYPLEVVASRFLQECRKDGVEAVKMNYDMFRLNDRYPTFEEIEPYLAKLK